MRDYALSRIEELFLNSIQVKETIIKDRLFKSLASMGEVAGNSIINGGIIMICNRNYYFWRFK